MSVQTRPIRRTQRFDVALPGFVAHASFRRPTAGPKYCPCKILAEPVDYSGSFMPDEVSRDYSKRMHYAAYRMHRAKSKQELKKWQQTYLQLRDQIVVGNRKLIYRAVQSFTRGRVDPEDYASDCQIVLIHAVVAFNPWIGIRFSTYAYTCLLRALSRMSKRASKDWTQRAISLDVFSDGEPQMRQNLPPGSASDYRLDEFLRADHPLLSEREKMVLTRRFNLNERSNSTTLEQVGEELGLSKERVRQVQASAITKLRKALTVNP